MHKNLLKVANMKNTNFWFEVDEDDKNLFTQKLKKYTPNDLESNWGFRAF